MTLFWLEIDSIESQNDSLMALGYTVNVSRELSTLPYTVCFYDSVNDLCFREVRFSTLERIRNFWHWDNVLDWSQERALISSDYAWTSTFSNNAKNVHQLDFKWSVTAN